MKDHPASTYAQGRIAICGDAAHASSPYHGAGAGFAIEDALVLAELFEDALEKIGSSKKADKARILKAVLAAYSEVRLERTQCLVEGSRYMGEMYQWQHGRDREKCKEEIDWRSRRIWDYDVEKMVADAVVAFERRIHRVNGVH
jgi:salicylate hydroxylase